jgi:hypothetical protein
MKENVIKYDIRTIGVFSLRKRQIRQNLVFFIESK